MTANPAKHHPLLLAFFILLTLVLAACTTAPAAQLAATITAPSPTATVTQTLPPTTPPTLSPTATLTLTPTASDLGVLTAEQRQRLYQSSLRYVADSEPEAILVARELDFLPSIYEHPSNLCGPLSIAILRDAGLVDPYIDVDKYWGMNPRPGIDAQLMERTFPRGEYLWYRDERPIDEIDFQAFPLLPGDFLYLFAGDHGTFEHILTVSRVDEAGRAYAVSNLNTEQGYLIQEVLLYDPTQAGVGQFYEWTDRTNIDLGITGFGGLQLWRPLNPIPERSPAQEALAAPLDAVLAEAGGAWNVLVVEIGGETLYSRRANESIHPVSTIKVPIAMLFFTALDQLGAEDYGTYMTTYGTGSRSFSQLLEAMLVESEEKAAASLVEWIAGVLDPEQVLASWGMLYTSIDPRRTTLLELAALYEGLYKGEWVSAKARGIILELMSAYTPNDDTRLGVLREYLAEGEGFYNKRGSTISPLIVADVAIIEWGEKAYLIAIFGQPEPEQDQPTYERLEAAIEEAALVIWEHICGGG